MLRGIRLPVAVIGLALVLVLSTGGLPALEAPLVAGGTGAGDSVDILGGLVTSSQVQTVSGTGNWVPLCAAATTVNCIVPIGVTYVASTEVVVFTQSVSFLFNDSRAVNAVQEVNPTTLALGPLERLNCPPGIPYYPGSGADVFVPCQLSSWVFVFNTQTSSIVANVSTPFPFLEMTVDSRDGMILSVDGGSVAALDPATETATVIANDTGAAPPNPLDGSGIVYDPAIDRLLTFSSTNQLLAVDLSTGASTVLAQLPPYPSAIGIDPSTGIVFTTIDDPSSVLVFNATTDVQLQNITIPWCVDSFCGDENLIGQFLVDPMHGDVYFASGLALFAVSLSSLSIVGTILNVGDGWAQSATYVPLSDEVFGTYTAAGGPAPAYLDELTHGNSTVLSGLLWMPVSSGILAIGLVAGLIAGVLSVGRRGVGNGRRP